MKNVTDFRKTVETGVDPRPKLLLNDDSESFLSNKYTSKALHQMLQTTKMNILKFQNPHFQSVLIFFKFVHLGLLLYLLCYQHSVNLCDHFYVSFNLVAVSTVRRLMKFATSSFKQSFPAFVSYVLHLPPPLKDSNVLGLRDRH